MAKANTKKSNAKAAPEPKAKVNGKPKQTEIPGAIKRIKAIDDAAEDYAAKRDERMELTVLEVDAKEKLLGLMKKHGIEVYRLDDERVAMIEHEVETVKVKRMTVEQAAKRAKKDDGGEAEAAAE